MEITISTPLFSTEDSQKIVASLEVFFPMKFRKTKSRIYGTSKSIEILSNLRKKIADARIKNTVMYLIEKNRKGNSSKFQLNKQTLIIGKIHFVEEEYPLGDVTVEFDDIQKVVEYLTK